MEAIIGVIGTVIGTILGWLLNSLSQKGKLNIHINSFNYNFERHQFGHMVRCEHADDVQSYYCKLSLDIYNSSAETKIMRNIKIVYANDKKIIKECTPNDYTTKKQIACAYHYDKIGPLNIPPKSIVTVVLSQSESFNENSIYNLLETQNIYLKYENEKNKTVKEQIAKINFNDYFKANEEEQDDG